MTIEEKIEAALFAHTLALNLEGTPPIAWPNVAFPAPGQQKPTTFIEALLLPNRNSRLFLKGSDPHLRQGILQLTVMTPLHVGSNAATKLAGAIAEHFPADLEKFEDGLRVRIQTAPDVGVADKTDDDVSWAVAVSIRYEAFA